MLSFVSRMLNFAGDYARPIKVSLVISLFEGILQSAPFVMIWLVLTSLINGELTSRMIVAVTVILGVTYLVRMVLRYIFNYLESGTGYLIGERERLALGDKLRRTPMGYFTEGNLGNITSALTVDIPFIEEFGMDSLDKVVSGYITSVIGLLMLFVIDWRMGLISLAAYILESLALRRIEKIGVVQSKHRQAQQAKLVATILEYTRGIGVIKAFHLGDKKAKNVNEAIEKTNHHSITFENQVVWPYFYYKVCYGLAIAVTIAAAGIFYSQGSLAGGMMIGVFIFIFNVFTPALAFASLSTQVRVAEAGLNRVETISQVPEISEGTALAPRGSHDIVFDSVGFSYGAETILEDVSLRIPVGSVTALVGPSGGGKTTIANLILRFWDVDRGRITLGGEDIRSYPIDELLGRFSVVFQNVYLFEDTVANNIRFGSPAATLEEIMAAAKKARCHDFIMNLPEGYDTVVGEGGDSLSGGEKQRISIARAILKDAPIIILDEATASVDPDNEFEIQEALSELIQHKTLVMIAHRLSTIQQADQILFVEDHGIAEGGTHQELMDWGGRYHALWQKRSQASSWKIGH